MHCSWLPLSMFIWPESQERPAISSLCILIFANLSSLYDWTNHLFFRDDSYFGKQEANGTKVFWGRGNGWVLAGIANILELLPKDSGLRPFYVQLFVELATQLSKLQDDQGFWHASLLDPDSYPSPETSSTALITYGLAYGLNHHCWIHLICLLSGKHGKH